MPERINFTRYPFTRYSASLLSVDDILAIGFQIAAYMLCIECLGSARHLHPYLLKHQLSIYMHRHPPVIVHLYITCHRFIHHLHHLHPSVLKHQLLVCMRQYPGFITTPHKFLIWFHSCSNTDNLGLVFNSFSDASVRALTILFYLDIIHRFTSHYLMESRGFLKTFYRNQGKFSKSHLDAEEDSFETCLHLQRELERSTDAINRRGAREARMSNAIGRGESELRLMTRHTRRIGRRREAR
jgi:hypothetical protein